MPRGQGQNHAHSLINGPRRLSNSKSIEGQKTTPSKSDYSEDFAALGRQAAQAKAGFKTYPQDLTFIGSFSNSKYKNEIKSAPPLAELSYPKNSLILIGGPYGAGKSTLADRILESNKNSARLDLNYDKQKWRKNFNKVFDHFFKDIEKKLKSGEGAVVELGGMKESHLILLSKLATKYGDEPHAIYIHASTEECIEGNRSRKRKLDDEVVKGASSQWENYLMFLTQTTGEGFMASGYWKTLGLHGFKSVRVFDRKAINKVEKISFS